MNFIWKNEECILKVSLLMCIALVTILFYFVYNKTKVQIRSLNQPVLSNECFC